MSGPRSLGDAIVIGGGCAGLATAALLGREGYRVTLLEARDELGGRAGSWQSEGFRFDTGPSWYLMPEVFEHFFRLLGTSSEEQLELVRLDPGYRVFFEGSERPLDVHAELQRNLDSFEAMEPGAARAVASYLDSARDTYETALRRFLYSTFSSPRSVMTTELARRAPQLMRLLLQPLDRFIAGFVSDRRIQQVLGYPAVFLGSSPYAAPSMYHLMSHLDLNQGVLYPLGGFAAVMDSFKRLATAEGVQIVSGARVTAILNDGGRRPHVSGVAYTDENGHSHTKDATLVVSTADLHFTETRLLPAHLRTYPERWWRRRVAGPGAVLVFLGVRGSLPELQHHTLFFTADWRDNFAKIFGPDSAVPEPASLYVCRPSASDASVAPSGSENLFVLVPVPADPRIGGGGRDSRGNARVERAADAAIKQIGEWAGIPDLAQRIVVRRTMGPADFFTDCNSWKGSALGPAHTARQSAFLRGRNTSSKLGGLLYAGATTVPGVGLPMCLISAELVVKRLRGDRSAGPLPEPS